ncbi:hypothetical protein C8246_05910 [Paracidovorax avenae]|nr:hypothetical protein C8246_05910 [Paracidovorax avenae]
MKDDQLADLFAGRTLALQAATEALMAALLERDPGLAATLALKMDLQDSKATQLLEDDALEGYAERMRYLRESLGLPASREPWNPLRPSA